MTDTLNQYPIRQASYQSRLPLYESAGHPGSVLRRPMGKVAVESWVDNDRRFAEQLLDLEEKFGISSPNMSLLKTEGQDGHPEIYIQGGWVEGKNLFDDSADIPVPVVKHAIGAIIDYYRQAADNSGPYLMDLKPDNIMYGRMADDTEDKLYFIDIEPLLRDKRPDEPLNFNDMDRIMPELWLLIDGDLKKNEGWDDLAESYQDLQRSQLMH
ncbi:hypothetical protein KW792_01100 [Candidatus Saccharibacteria bacterium]|nr:hypothetical protein [Candidatus Saccharibacteria bacterium]